MNLSITEEQMAPYFDKLHIHGLPFPASINHFKESDISEDYHNHPFSFYTTMLRNRDGGGGYREEVVTLFPNGTWKKEIFDRVPGMTYHVKACTIHKILGLLSGECFTFMQPDINETAEQTDWQMWRFCNGVAEFRTENKGEWQQFNPSKQNG